QLFSHLANIGDTRSLILHPASTTHRQLSDEQRLAAGGGPGVVRPSIGLESPHDFIPHPAAAPTRGVLARPLLGGSRESPGRLVLVSNCVSYDNMSQLRAFDLPLAPNKRGSSLVIHGGEVADRVRQLLGTAKARAGQGLLGKDAEPDLDLVQPARRSRREVGRDIGVRGKPRLVLLMSCRGRGCRGRTAGRR